ncbi:MAG: hypothetical protein KAU90_10340, partial [Sulfurovaceae bacterium]|nr:hypothetical protein [Sulfurovaceae bacterium]
MIEYYIKKKDLQTLKVIYFIGLLDDYDIIKDHYIYVCFLKIDEISKYCNLSTKETIHILKKMSEKSIEIEDTKYGTVKYIPTISYVSINSIENKIKIHIYYNIYNKFRELTQKYSFSILRLMFQTKYKYTLKFIFFLQTIDYSNILLLDEINRVLDTKYKRLSYVTKILEKIREELDLYSTISFLFEVNYLEESKPKSSKKAVSITVIIKRNRPKESNKSDIEIEN